jgi:hypothetical protein
MRFELMKKNNKKKWIIGSIAALGLISVGIYASSYAKYQKIEDLKLAEGKINYKPYDFKIVAMYKSDDGTNYTEIDTMPESGYVINESKSYCMADNNTQVKGKLKTVNGIHSVTGLKKNEKCYIWFDLKSITIDDIIATLNPKTTTPTFSNIATTDEGVYSVSDGMYGGNSYYWRGAATTNYVKFAGKCWRIVRINGDKTMRLIYDGATCHANGTSTADSIAVSKTAYNSISNKSEYVGWKYTNGAQRPSSITSGTNAPIKTALENWYNSNIGNNAIYANKVADGKYCNDRNVQSGQSWATSGSTFFYTGYKRLYTDYAPTLSCTALDTYTLKAGLITADEVMYAGGKGHNTSYYLYNGQYYWTMSPCYWNGEGSSPFVFFVHSNGYFDGTYVSNTSPGVRPVINLKSDTLFTARGNGTLENPYIVAD